jgi:hypothetical protein
MSSPVDVCLASRLVDRAAGGLDECALRVLARVPMRKPIDHWRPGWPENKCSARVAIYVMSSLSQRLGAVVMMQTRLTMA